MRKNCKKSANLKNIMRCRSLWKYDILIVSMALWKSVAVPSLTTGNAVLKVDWNCTNCLDSMQYQKGKFALGIQSNVSKEFIIDEIGWSTFEEREAACKISFAERINRMQWKITDGQREYLKPYRASRV